ncbi:hypothetical protein MK489_16720 [Myxococcota bacterium]|nr:hypothetical protein [Myxococcota bacterium]
MRIDHRGRVALLDLVKTAGDETHCAFSDPMKRILHSCQGRLAWAGSMDQQLIGTGSEDVDSVWISEFPNREACATALEKRYESAPEMRVRDIQSYVVTPWPSPIRWIARTTFRFRGLLGGGPPPYDPSNEPPPSFTELEMGAQEFGPTPEQYQALERGSLETRVVMVNFLDFRDHANYREPESNPQPRPHQSTKAHTHGSGSRAYGRYSANTIKLVGRLGGRLRWAGFRARRISEGTEQAWRQIALMEYPSRAHFLGMVRDEAYKVGIRHRDAGLSRTELLACTSHVGFE